MNIFQEYKVFILTLVYIVLLVILIFALAVSRVPDPIPGNMTVNELKEKIGTGDLLLVKYRSKHGVLVKSFTESSWSHVALVYNKSVVEISGYNDDYYGLCVIPIDKWLSLNKKRLCGYKKYRGKPIDEEKLNYLLEKYNGVELDAFLINWLKAMFKVEWSPQEKKEDYFCSEFTALLLQELSVIPKQWTPTSYSPKMFNEMKEWDETKVFINNYLE